MGPQTRRSKGSRTCRRVLPKCGPEPRSFHDTHSTKQGEKLRSRRQSSTRLTRRSLSAEGVLLSCQFGRASRFRRDFKNFSIVYLLQPLTAYDLKLIVKVSPAA